MGTMNESVIREEWENATLANNFIFYKVMRHHPEECKHLIEMLLKVKIESMEIHNEEVVSLDYDAKGIRMDVYIKENQRMYDIEIQVVNTKELPERSRYYAALMCLDTLKAGDKYKDLRDGHVIFICMEDIFGQGLPIYTFENICLENKKTKLNDRDYKHFFIAPTCAKIAEDNEIKHFFDFLISNNANSTYTSKLSEYVDDAKHNMQWRHEYMTYERIQAYAFDQGLEKGTQQKAIEDTIAFLKENIDPNIIAKCVKLPIEKVLELQKEISVQA